MDLDSTQVVDDSNSSQQESDAQTISPGRSTSSHQESRDPCIADDDDADGDDTDISMTDEDAGLTQQTNVDEEEEDDDDDLGETTQEYLSASQVVEDDGEEEVEDDGMQVGNYTKTRTEKDILVAQLLCRWWYVLPDWPPSNYNYLEKLQERKLKCYSVKEFEDHENVDGNGFRKCYQISAFPGVFRDFQGVAYDLRPPEGKPCYNNLIQKTEEELISLIKTAINKQIEILTASQYDETQLVARLKEELAGLG